MGKDKGRSFNWQALRDEQTERTRSIDAQLQRIESEHRAWFQRELQRPGANITGGAPDEVNNAVWNLQRQRRRVVGAHFDEVQDTLRAERKIHQASILTKIEELRAELARMYAFDQNARTFAGSASRYLQKPVERPYQDLLNALDQYVAEDHLRSTAPPAPPIYEGPETNPIVVPTADPIVMVPIGTNAAVVAPGFEGVAQER